jgi:ABC-type transport system involved in multi-copper enzyme maturation permease subunit
MIRQFYSEWMRGRGRPVEKFAGAFALLLGVMIPLIMVARTASNQALWTSALTSLAFPGSLSGGRAMMTILGPLFAAAIGSNIVGAEYQYGTWPWLLVRASSRTKLLVAKMLAAAARIIAIGVAGVALYMIVGALVLAFAGAPLSKEIPAARFLFVPFIDNAGNMAFAAAVAMTVTLASRSSVFGMLAGVMWLPVLAAIRFKETASWIPLVHLQNIQEKLLFHRASPFLASALDFHMSGRASAAILGIELLVVLAAALAIFRRQEIVY